jgi:SAM-dependent methyltransferase
MDNFNQLANRFVHQRTGKKNTTADQVRWLRAGGRLDEWADNTVVDIQFAGSVLNLNDDDSILNLSCGWGRHAITLAHYGLNVIGLDESDNLVELARETSRKAGINIHWICGKLDDLLLTDPVDAVVQFHDNLLTWADGPSEALFQLDMIHSIIKDDGLFLFGSTDWQATPPLQEQRLSETPKEKETYHRYFDPESRTILGQTIVVGRDGSRSEFWHHAWYPTVEQMEALLVQAHFYIEGQFNDFSYLPYDSSIPGLVWLVRKD